MLPPFIIEQIRKREEEERKRGDQPIIQLPLPDIEPDAPRIHVEEEPERGVVIIDLMSRPRRPS